jgi:hypothetical protein
MKEIELDAVIGTNAEMWVKLYAEVNPLILPEDPLRPLSNFLRNIEKER